jgi:hypothetical protein
LRPNTFHRTSWAPAIEAAGVVPLRKHDMRHTAVALWIASGMNVKEVSARAGHTSVSFTLDRYGHLFPSQDETAVARMDALYDTTPRRPEGQVVSLSAPRETREPREKPAGFRLSAPGSAI